MVGHAPAERSQRFDEQRERLRSRYLKAEDARPPSSGRGLHHAALVSSDVERTIRFYQDQLEFPLIESPVVLWLPNVIRVTGTNSAKNGAEVLLKQALKSTVPGASLHDQDSAGPAHESTGVHPLHFVHVGRTSTKNANRRGAKTSPNACYLPYKMTTANAPLTSVANCCGAAAFV